MQFRGSAVVLNLFLLTSLVSASPVAEACHVLASAFPEQVYISGSSAYDAENNDYWSASAVLAPACIFAPGNAAEVSHAVNTLTAFRAPFAVKGGGGMTVDGYANIDKGVVISLVNLTSVEVSDDLSLIKFGAGNNWDAVYGALKPYKRTTVGGRMGLVGVSGYLLGGGVGFLNNQYGFAATNVAEYECVLANGTIITATETNPHADLYWALKGGGNSFAIVTAFTMRTHPSGTNGTIAGAYPTYSSGQRTAFVSALHAFALHGAADPKGALEPQMIWDPAGGAPTFSTTLVYDGATTDPAVLRNWTGGGALQPEQAERPLLQPTTLWDYTRAPYGGVERPFGKRARFIASSLRAGPDTRALDIVIDDFFPALDGAGLADVANITVSLVFQPWRADFIEASEAYGGNPMGYDAAKAPYIWFIQAYAWSDPADDERVERFYRGWTPRIEGRLEKEGMRDPFVFMNDADAWQDVFGGYEQANVRKLKKIRQWYDPDMVFTKLMPGGFKVENA